MATSIKVVSFRQSGTNLVVEFDDYTMGIWTPNDGGFGEAGCVEVFRIVDRNLGDLARFHSGRQNPHNTPGPDGFRVLADDWTPERVCEYWDAALRHIMEQSKQAQAAGQEPSDELRYAVWVMFIGTWDLEQIQDGRWPAPATT